MRSSFEINAEIFPQIYTNKIIIAYWPFVPEKFKGINKHIYKYIDVKDFIHDNLLDYEGNTRCFDYNNSDSWADQFMTQVCDIANDINTETPYILIDGSIEIIEWLKKEEMNYILVIPYSYKQAKEFFESIEYLGIPNYMNNERAYYTMAAYISKKSFRTLCSYEPFYNYIYNAIGIIDFAHSKAIEGLVGRNSNNLDNTLGFETEIGEENENLVYSSYMNYKETTMEAEAMIKDPNYIAYFQQEHDPDICDHEEEYEEFSDDDCLED